jgi:hypothetical protein
MIGGVRAVSPVSMSAELAANPADCSLAPPFVVDKLASSTTENDGV